MARWNARFGLFSCLGFGIGKDRGNWIDWNAQRELSKKEKRSSNPHPLWAMLLLSAVAIL